jgi:cytidylate kinase
MGTYIPTLRAYESQLLEEFFSVIKARKTPIIAIGGFSGTGKDTVALFIQEYFKKFHNINLKITGAGDLVRNIAIESGWKERNLDEFMKHIQMTQNEEFAQKVDLEIEKRALKTALLEGGIFIGRLAPFAIGTNGLTIWLEVAARIIAQRISHDKNRAEYGMDTDELMQRIKKRDSTDGERLENIYGISFRDKKHFSLTLRNEGFSIKELKKKIEKLLLENFPPPNQN